MEVDDLLANVRGLFEAVKSRTRSRYHIGKELPAHDKGSIKRWFEEGKDPQEPTVIAEIVQLALKLGIGLEPFQRFAPIYSLSEFVTYEEKAAQAPPDLTWLTAAPELPGNETTTVSFCGLTARCPLGIASSPLMSDDRWGGLMLDLGFGISTFKTRRSHEKHSWDGAQIAVVADDSFDPKLYDPANPPEVIVTFGDPRHGVIKTLVNSMGVPSERHPREWQDKYLKLKEHRTGSTVGLSVMADGDTLPEVLQDLEVVLKLAIEVHPPFIELNISCPNLEKKVDLCANLATVESLIRAAKKILEPSGIPLFLKIPFLPTAALETLFKKVGSSANAIVFRNTLRVRPIRLRDRDGAKVSAFQDRIFGGMSGPLTFNLTRQGVIDLLRVRERLGIETAVIAVGGVSSAQDVVTLLNDGADAVQVCNGAVYDPLLAWKTQFYMTDPQTVVVKKAKVASDRFLMIQPVHEVERESMMNLELAVREIRKRDGRDVPHVLVVERWNQWMATRRASDGQGMAQRSVVPPAARSVAEWVRVLR